MSAAVLPAARPSSDRVRRVVETVRWAPAPRFAGSAADKTRFVVYVAGSMVGWTAAGLGIAALLGAIVS